MTTATAADCPECGLDTELVGHAHYCPHSVTTTNPDDIARAKEALVSTMRCDQELKKATRAVKDVLDDLDVLIDVEYVASVKADPPNSGPLVIVRADDGYLTVKDPERERLSLLVLAAIDTFTILDVMPRRTRGVVREA